MTLRPGCAAGWRGGGRRTARCPARSGCRPCRARYCSRRCAPRALTWRATRPGTFPRKRRQPRTRPPRMRPPRRSGRPRSWLMGWSRWPNRSWPGRWPGPMTRRCTRWWCTPAPAPQRRLDLAHRFPEDGVGGLEEARTPGGHRQQAAGADHSPHIRDEPRHIRREEHPEHADHRIEAAVRQRGPGRIAVTEDRVGQALAGGPGAGYLQQRLRDVDAEYVFGGGGTGMGIAGGTTWTSPALRHRDSRAGSIAWPHELRPAVAAMKRHRP